MKIYGAGLAGLLAGHMLRRYEPEIHEIQDSLPSNHEAVLRFRTEAVSIATAIPFKKIRVTKQIYYGGEVLDQDPQEVSPFLANMYSMKVTGQVLERSIGNLAPVDRWVAPPDFIQQMARGLNIIYSSPLTFDSVQEEGVKISTIPMPMLIEIAPQGVHFNSETKNLFKARPVWNVVADLAMPKMDVYQTTYFPGAELPYYRATLTGARLIIEYSEEPTVYTDDIDDIMKIFGIGEYVTSDIRRSLMAFGKLIPVPAPARQSIIRIATEKYQCFSLGRFATWRQILLDDVVNDVKVIEQLIDADPYTRALVEAQ